MTTQPAVGEAHLTGRSQLHATGDVTLTAEEIELVLLLAATGQQTHTLTDIEREIELALLLV